MQKIKDRDTLSMVAGFMGFVAVTIIDGLSRRANLSKRSYREAAAGIFLSRREATSWTGQIFGGIMSLAISILGADIVTKRLTKGGKDHLLVKGTIVGIVLGAISTVLPTFARWNKMRPKDAVSNMSYVITNIFYGLLTAFSVAKLGHESLFDVSPQNDYIKPTEKTSDQLLTTEKVNKIDHESFIHDADREYQPSLTN